MNTEQLVINHIGDDLYENKVFEFKGSLSEAKDLAREKNFQGGVHIDRPHLKEIKFKKDVSVRYETSGGAITPTEKVIMTYNVWADKIKQRGGFEMYDNSNNYAEGGLWFRENELVDYDGMFSLDLNIIDQLGKWGFNVDAMRKSMIGEE